MVIARRRVASTLAVGLVAVVLAAVDPSHAGRLRSAPPAPTIEPTLPLVIDMRFEEVERTGWGARGRLIIEIRAEGTIGDLSIGTTLGSGLRLEGDGGVPRGPLTLARGQARRFVVNVIGDGDTPGTVRIEASFNDGMGRPLRLGQGVSLLPAAEAQGRSHLGAWEVMAVTTPGVPR